VHQLPDLALLAQLGSQATMFIMGKLKGNPEQTAKKEDPE
jgi:hypothetical protein